LLCHVYSFDLLIVIEVCRGETSKEEVRNTTIDDHFKRFLAEKKMIMRVVVINSNNGDADGSFSDALI
jgi:hypothetical protein